jgi:hypothetical protein
MNRGFYLFGACIGRHPRRVLFAWAIAIGLGIWGGSKFQIAAQSGGRRSGGTPVGTPRSGTPVGTAVSRAEGTLHRQARREELW